MSTLAPEGAYNQPLAMVVWVPRDQLRPNNYNPNSMTPVDRALLKVSILANGWTQPIVLFNEHETDTLWIVDGEHRWQVSADPDVAALTGGLVPVVYITGNMADRMMATIRHNRARGSHGVVPMAEIVRQLIESGMEDDAICQLLQMEREELGRLAERAGRPEVMARYVKDFQKGWVPSNDSP